MTQESAAEETPNDRALSRQEERKRVDDMNLSIGSCVRVVWRTRGTPDEEEGDWTTSVVTVCGAEVDDNGRKRYTTEFDIGGRLFEGCLPLGGDFEARELTRVRAAARKLEDVLSAKRRRTETPQHEHPTSAAATAIAMMDVKRGKPTVGLPNGEGLRVPASSSQVFAAVFPHVWWARLSEETSPSELVVEWRAAAETLRNYLGATFRAQTRRDAYFVAVENLVALVLRPPPANRLEWRLPFANVRAFLRELFCVIHSARAAEALDKKIADQFENGVVDIEAAICDAEGTAEPQQLQQQQQQQRGPGEQSHEALQEQVRILKAQCAALAANNPGSNQHASTRGGRGGGRSGRSFRH